MERIGSSASVSVTRENTLVEVDMLRENVCAATSLVMTEASACRDGKKKGGGRHGTVRVLVTQFSKRAAALLVVCSGGTDSSPGGRGTAATQVQGIRDC